MKPKVILDIGFLGHAHEEKSARRGAQRVAQHLFDGLVASGRCDLSFAATTHLAGAHDFLAAQNPAASERLYYRPRQLARSRFARQLAGAVKRTLDDRSLAARLRRRVLSKVIHACARGEVNFDPRWLDHADIYHSPHTPYPEAVHRHTRLKKFITLHDFIPLRQPEYFSRHAQPFMDAVLACLKPGNFAFCVSETTRNDALNLSPIPPENVFVTPLAADAALFHPVTETAALSAVRQRLGIPEAPYFLAVSAQDRHKNFPHLIRCFGALVEAGELTDTNLVIAGANPARNPEVMEALARYPRVRPRVILPGFVPDADLAAVYSGATAFLFPSFAEGFGIPPLEAMQCGTPVIGSNTTSIPEVVGDAGILLPPTDEAAWCQAILKLERDADLRAGLQQKSRERSKLFSWEKFIERTLEGYAAAMKTR
jgi:glycosyltransferase involved in cell wall biosynthesis